MSFYSDPNTTALLFEMTPQQGHEDHYFSHVAKLRPLLLQHEGLIFVERFKSLSRPDVILSHSLWGEEFESVTEKNSFLTFGEVQTEAEGRDRILDAQGSSDLKSALLSRVSRDYGLYDRAEAPQYFDPVEQ